MLEGEKSFELIITACLFASVQVQNLILIKENNFSLAVLFSKARKSMLKHFSLRRNSFPDQAAKGNVCRTV